MITKQEAHKSAVEFLNKHQVGVVSTADLGGQPFASAVYYAAKDDLTIYFLTSHSTHKHQNIVKNNKTAFTVGFGPEYVAVELRGRTVVVEGVELAEASALMIAVQLKVPMVRWPVERIEALKKGGLVMYKIIPEEATFLNLDSSEHIESLADYMYQILP
jgi:uncharacterized pyridoxamine 5'-phosphate oxidase family protein